MSLSLSTKIRRIIAAEFRQEQPAFKVVKHLEDALKEALAREDKLSVDDVGKPARQGGSGVSISDGIFTVNNGTTTGTANITVGGFGDSDGDTGPDPYSSPRRRRETMQDQMLATMDHVIARASQMHDPLTAVAQMVPHLETLYPDEEEREAILDRIREEVRGRLAEQPHDITPAAQEEPLGLENNA